MRLLGQSSPGVRSSYTVFPKSPPPVSRPEAPLLGFHAPTTHQEKRVHVRLSPAPRFCRGVRPRVPPRRLRCRSQVFSTSQRPSSSLHRPTIFRWVASMGFALQGFVPLTKPRRLVVVRPTLLTLLPRADLSPFLGGDTRRRGGSYLGAFIRRLLFVYRVFVLVTVDRTRHPFSQRQCPTCPSWALTSSWCAPERNGEGFPLLDRRASRARGRRLPPTRCPPRLTDHPGRPTLTSGPSHLKVSRLQPAHPFGVPPARAYRPCDLSPRPAVPRRRDPCVPLSAV
jgi:hypothetical protein